MLNVILIAFHLLTSTLRGTVSDEKTGETIAHAQVTVVELNTSAISDEKGNYEFKELAEGTYTISVQANGYEAFQTEVKISSKTESINLQLKSDHRVLEEVVVEAINADKRSGTTYTNITAKDLKPGNLGQDLPYLLNSTPSVVITSDAGAGVGYTGIRIRGTDASRVNVTINGIPINDAESHGTYWVDMPDLASSVGNIQIQRGVGTSTNGSAAFGASINVQTNNLSKVAFSQVSSSAGSFNTFKNTFQAGTGLIKDKFAFEARLSKITSDGFIDRASSDLKSFSVSGAYFGKKSVLKANIFSGKEKTYQSWNGVPEDTLKAGKRTYNQYTYPNQTDNYQQDNYQLIYTKELNKNFDINAALHYTRGIGYYEEFISKDDALGESKLSKYKLPNVITATDTFTTSDLVRQKWLSNHFYGGIFSVNYNDKKKVRALLGGGWNQYLGGHYNKVIWSRYGVDNSSNLGDNYYDITNIKTDGNIYGKIYYQLLPELNVFADMQVRMLNYSFTGVDTNSTDLRQHVHFAFFNPKGGFTYEVSKNHFIYASAAVAQKEPTNNDYINSSSQSRPKSEKLINIEAGIKGEQKQITYSANLYWMDYQNQLVATGQLSDVGLYNRVNVDKSYRAGIELQAGTVFSKLFSASLNLTLSRNKIAKFTEYQDNWDTWGQETIKHSNTDISFSPNIIFGGQLIFTPAKGLSLTLLPKYVGKQYLDNTSNDNRKLNEYFVSDFRINYTVPQAFMKDLRFALQVNNIFNKQYESNGWTYPYINGGKLITSNNYYPQAGTNFLVGATLRF